MNKGVASAFFAYIMWGFFPIYFRALDQVPPIQTLAHRIVWSFLFMLLILVGRKEIKALKQTLRPKILLIYLLAGVLLAANWFTFVWGVSSGYVLESSLGYFINPLVSVLLGVIFLHEKLRPLQWVPVGLAAAGVLYLTISLGKLPWIALILAFSFGLYGLMKKIAPLGSLQGLTLETGAVFLPALGILLFAEATGKGVYGHTDLITTILLSLVGIVTAVPLLFFATGARRVPLSTMGLLQYVSPTIQFFIGVFLFGEPFSHQRLIGFSMIWIALAIFTAESLLHRSDKPLIPNISDPPIPVEPPV